MKKEHTQSKKNIIHKNQMINKIYAKRCEKKCMQQNMKILKILDMKYSAIILWVVLIPQQVIQSYIEQAKNAITIRN